MNLYFRSTMMSTMTDGEVGVVREEEDHPSDIMEEVEGTTMMEDTVEEAAVVTVDRSGVTVSVSLITLISAANI